MIDLMTPSRLADMPTSCSVVALHYTSVVLGFISQALNIF